MILGYMPEVRRAVTLAVGAWFGPGGLGGFNEQTMPGLIDQAKLVDSIVREVSQTDIGREVRTLRWKNKNLGKQLGQSGHKIYELRCQLAEVRTLVGVDRTSYRAARDQIGALQKLVLQKADEISALRGKLAAAETLLARESDRANVATALSSGLR